jgi:iron complex outermembrane receptor protein
VGVSYRTGLELDMSVKIHPHLKFVCAYALSQNKINAITMRYSNTASLADTFLVFNNTDAAFSPSFILNQGLNFTPNKWLEIEYTNRYVSEQFLDNTSNSNLQLPSYSISDLKLQFNVAQFKKKILPSLSFRVQNVFNEKYCPMGSIQSYTNTIDPKNRSIGSTPLYFPAATRNYFVTLNWLF